jgi:hypothetical protein
VNEIMISCDRESPQDKDSEINISILNDEEEQLLYKFIVGLEGTWETLKDFGQEKSVTWKPKESGSYILMVQAKKENSSKAFDYVSRKQFTIGYANEKLISDIYIDKEIFKIGEKVTVTVESKEELIMFRYFIKEREKWILAKDYSIDNVFMWSANSTGKQEVLVQCKFIHSEKTFEDATKIDFEVEDIENIEITDFKCLNSILLADEELTFEVNAIYEDSRTTLYKFIKLDLNGQAKCMQDYCTKKVVSFKEEASGEYKLLCLAKDMYSPKEYDDRAVIYYEVKPYKPIEIQSFTSDLSSPQAISQKVTLKAVASGGKELRYRFIIEGEENEDSGYIKSNSFAWGPKKEGSYKINLWVKDVSFKGKYEVSEMLYFDIDELARDPVTISEVILNKSNNVLIGEEIKVKAIAQGGTKLLYSYILKIDNIKYEEVIHSESNCFEFTPEKEGRYQLEIRVKDKYSSKEFDVHAMISIQVYEYIPAVIDYVLMEPREYYLVGDQVVLDVITRETQNTLIKYALLINGHKVEETDYVKGKRYIVTPKCSGRYSVKIYAKNENSTKDFDSVKDIALSVNDAPPIMNTMLKCDNIEFFCNEPVNVTAESFGGKDVVYEFYLMEKSEWTLVQSYGKKTYYTFIPFTKGVYKILVLAKSSYKKSAYEDYCIIDIRVNEKILEYKGVLDSNLFSSNRYEEYKEVLQVTE